MSIDCCWIVGRLAITQLTQFYIHRKNRHKSDVPDLSIHWCNIIYLGAPIFTLPESKIEATIGKQTEMKINVQSTLEFKNIKWHKKCNQNNAISNVIITNQGNSIHLTYKFTEITETGFYYCTARTFFRTGKSPNMYVEVKKSCKYSSGLKVI